MNYTVQRYPLLAALLALLFLGAETPENRAGQQAALAPYQAFVGDWKGAGQVRRGSTQGAWTETAGWAWKYGERSAALEFTSPDGKHVRTATLTAGPQAGALHLALTGPAGQTQELSGASENNGNLVFTANPEKALATLPARATLRLVAGGDRLVMLLEQKAGNRYTTLAEIGYTRVGSGFGQGTSFRECVVTGGRGTIEVTHAGKTYYVCCTGCRDLFNDNPEGVLRDYRLRKEKEKKTPKAGL